MDIAKNEVMKTIAKRINELLLNEEILFNGRTTLKSGTKDMFLKNIKNPILFLKENSYSIDKPISFRGTGDFVFVEDIKKKRERSKFIYTQWK